MFIVGVFKVPTGSFKHKCNFFEAAVIGVLTLFQAPVSGEKSHMAQWFFDSRRLCIFFEVSLRKQKFTFVLSTRDQRKWL